MRKRLFSAIACFLVVLAVFSSGNGRMNYDYGTSDHVQFVNTDFSSPTLVTTNTFLKSSASVVNTDDGKIYVAWSEQNGADYDIFFSYSANNGTTFTSPDRVNNITSGHQLYPKIAVDDSGVVLVTWWDQSNDFGDIAFTRSLDGGVSFEDEIIIHGETEGTQQRPEIAANGNRMAIVYEDSFSDNRIRIWNPVDGSLIRVLEGHTGAVRSVDFTSAGTRLASGSEDNLAKIWNPQTGSLIRNITEHTAIVTAVNWSSDGNMLATGSWDYNVTLWDTSDYSIITKLNQTDNIPILNPVNALAFSPDGSQIAVAYNGKLGGGMPIGGPEIMFNLTVWNLSDYSNWTVKHGGDGAENSVTDVAFSHNGTLIASCGKDNCVKIWNSTTSFRYEQAQFTRDVLSVCWSPDDTQIAASLDNGSIVIFNLTDSTEQYWLNSQHTGRVNALSWSEVRNELVSGASDPQAKIWDITSELETWNLSGHTNSVYSVDWSTDGSFVATAGGNSRGYQLGENQIFCVVSDDSGATLSDPSMISDSCSSTRLRPRAGIDGNGNISVVWYDRRNGGSDIYYSNSTDGLAFTQNFGVSTVAGVDENIPDVSVEDNGKVHVTWQYSLGGGDIRIHYANSSDGFANFIEVSNLGQLPRISVEPSGSAVLVTWRNAGLISDISYDGGLTFADQSVVNASMYSDSSISINSYGQASIVWLDWSRQNIYHVSTILKYSIPLQQGWNLISLPLARSEESIDQLLTSIDGKWDCILVYDPLSPEPWKSNCTFKPDQLNEFETLNHTMGFWINITEPNVNLTVGGYIPTSTTISLYAGWNLVGYPSLTNETVANALWGTGADKVEVFDPAEPYRIKEVGPTYVMKPGEGYWVHVPADTIWIIDW